MMQIPHIDVGCSFINAIVCDVGLYSLPDGLVFDVCCGLKFPDLGTLKTYN